MSRESISPVNRRQAAGRANRRKRGPLTESGRERLRAAALRVQPWQQATGPKTPEGRAQSAQNGRYRQAGPKSVREGRAELAGVYTLLREIDATCRQLTETLQPI